MLVELTYGGAMWDKPTGTLRVSGLALPTGHEPQLGEWVTVKLAGVNIAAIVGNEVRVTSWVCTPTGFQFAGEKTAPPDIGGAVGSAFECYAEYLATIGVDISLQLNMDISQLKFGSSPWPDGDNGWYDLSTAIADLGGGDWVIPAVANVPVESIALNGYENASVIVGSMVPGANKLYVVDGFNNIVTKMTALTAVPDNASAVTFGTHFGTPIDAIGGAADPILDPRPEGTPGKMTAEVRQISEETMIGTCADNFPSSIYCAPEGPSIYDAPLPDVYIVGVFLQDSNSPWCVLSSKGISSWVRSWGPKNQGTMPTSGLEALNLDVFNAIFEDAGTSKPTSIVRDLFTKIFEVVGPLYNTWYYANAFTQTSFNFKNLYGQSNPLVYQNPITKDELSVTVIDNAFYQSLLDGITTDELEAAGVNEFTFKLPEFVFYGYTDSNDIDGEPTMGEYFQEITDKMDAHEGLVTASLKSFVYEEKCTGTTSMGQIPYLFRRVKEIKLDYRISPVVLNLQSEFWLADPNTQNLFATDSRGVRIWVFPHDNVETFCKNVVMCRVLQTWLKTFEDNAQARKDAVMGYIGFVQTIKQSTTTLYYFADLLNVKLQTEDVDAWRRYLNEISGWVPEPINAILSTVEAVAAESSSNQASAAAYYLMRRKDPTLEEKVKKKAIYIDDALHYADPDNDKSKAYSVNVLNAALTWIEDNGGLRNLECNPIEVNRTVTSYTDNTRIVEDENKISGDKHASEEMLPAGGAVLYASPAQTRASTITSTTSGAAVSTESTKISDWTHLNSFKSSMSPFEDKKMVFYSMDDKFETAGEGYTESMTLLAKKHIRNVRLNISADGRAKVSHSLMGILDAT